MNLQISLVLCVGVAVGCADLSGPSGLPEGGAPPDGARAFDFALSLDGARPPDGATAVMDGGAPDRATASDLRTIGDSAGPMSDGGSLANTILAGNPIYSLVANAAYTGRIILRAKISGATVIWKRGGSNCGSAQALACLPTQYGIVPPSDATHDWRCEIDALAALGPGNAVLRACDGSSDPSVTISVVAQPAQARPFAPGIYLQQKVGATQIGPTEATYLAGANLLLFWWELQPSIDAFDDTQLTSAVNQPNWASIMLLVKTGSENTLPSGERNGTPNWLVAAAPSAGLGRPLHTDGIGVGPYPWDPVYQDLAQNLMAHVAAVVGANAKLAGVYIAGATSHYNEMILTGSADLTTVNPAAGLTASEPVPPLDINTCSQYIDAWKRALDTMNSQFQVQIITPLDTVPACSGAVNAPYDVFKANAAAPYSPSTRAFGTANLGYYVDKNGATQQTPTFWNATPKFFDRYGVNPTPEYFEMGPFKMDPGSPTPSQMGTRVTYVLSAASWGNPGAYFAADAVAVLQGTWSYGAPVQSAVCNAVRAYSRWWPAGKQPASCP